MNFGFSKKNILAKSGPEDVAFAFRQILHFVKYSNLILIILHFLLNPLDGEAFEPSTLQSIG